MRPCEPKPASVCLVNLSVSGAFPPKSQRHKENLLNADFFVLCLLSQTEIWRSRMTGINSPSFKHNSGGVLGMSTVEALLKEFRSGTRKVADYVEEIIENAQSNADLGRYFFG